MLVSFYFLREIADIFIFLLSSGPWGPEQSSPATGWYYVQPFNLCRTLVGREGSSYIFINRKQSFNPQNQKWAANYDRSKTNIVLTFLAWVKNVKEHLVSWIMKMWCIHTMEVYSTVTKNKDVKFSKEKMKLEDITFSETTPSGR